MMRRLHREKWRQRFIQTGREYLFMDTGAFIGTNPTDETITSQLPVTWKLSVSSMTRPGARGIFRRCSARRCWDRRGARPTDLRGPIPRRRGDRTSSDPVKS